MVCLSNIVEISGENEKPKNFEALVVNQNVFEKIGQYVQLKG